MTSQYINAGGLLALAAMSLVVIVLGLPPIIGALACMAAYFGTVAIPELVVLKTHRRLSTGLTWTAAEVPPPDYGRVAVKLVGLAVTLAVVVGVHWAARIYALAELEVGARVLLVLSPVAIPLTCIYFAFVDRRMVEPRDGYWLVGRLVLGRTDAIERSVLRDHVLGWAIKAFFLPIMFYYLAATLERLQGRLNWLQLDYIHLTRWLTDYSAALELSIVCVGYTCTVRLFDSHIRSPNSSVGAWLVTLACYAPFNHIVTGTILRYDDGSYWFDWVGATPLLAIPWCIALCATFGLWVWATAAFGIRWSNLTNRGIITNGPYRFLRHPDYVSKSIFFWLIHVPFLSTAGPLEAARVSAMLVGVNLIYYARAKFEERHLAADPAYAAYLGTMAARRARFWRALQLGRVAPGTPA